jgi:hypothetical protein
LVIKFPIHSRIESGQITVSVARVRGREREEHRDAHRMATAKRLNIEEGEDLVALEELEGRDIAYRTESGMLVHYDVSRVASIAHS